MKLNNLSAKKICRLISTGMVFSMLVITGIFGGIMQDTRIFIAGGTLTLCAFFWIWLLVLFFGKRLSHLQIADRRFDLMRNIRNQHLKLLSFHVYLVPIFLHNLIQPD